MRTHARLGTAILVLVVQACMPPLPPPPTLGYGEPYKGTGQPINVKDSRNDWDITEGNRPMTSEQALEASGDPEYEARRQIAKHYNDQLYSEGKTHRRNGTIMMGASIGVAIIGFLAGAVLASSTLDTTTVPADNMMPEMRTTVAGGTAKGFVFLGNASLIVGLIGLGYGWYGGSRPPPYHRWHTPEALNRPAYVRQHTEEYNDKLGAPATGQPHGPVDDGLGLAPGQRKPPPPRPTRGGGR